MTWKLFPSWHYSVNSWPVFARLSFALLACFIFSLTSFSNASAQELSPGHNEASALAVAPRHQAAWLDFALGSMLEEAKQNILLNAEDTENYQAIFTAQSKGAWAEADRKIAKLSDKRLMGHILAQRYMRPVGYKASYGELKNWLASYADLPEAGKIHALALKRRPKGEHSKLEIPNTTRGLTGGLAAAAVMGSGNHDDWRDGLAAWQKHDYTTAFENFRALARNESANPWDQAAGAFWAARCLTRMGQPAEVTPWLKRAAALPRTFYGLLANRQLGTETALNWSVPDLRGDHLLALNTLPAGHRALALLQVGQLELAEDELRTINPRGDDQVEEALVALSAVANLPGLALRLGTAIPAPNGTLYDAVLYPIPQWEPQGGFKVDRALIYALVRQESRFETDAKSQVGATGLMQLMPATASYIAGRSFTPANLNELHDPELNLTLGQRYVQELLGQDSVDHNLFYLLAAYNSGPTQVLRWRASMPVSNDPLLFIETLPASETRDFIERVLANYWIYQLQMNKPTPSLDAASAGDWPRYVPSEETPLDMRVADVTPLN